MRRRTSHRSAARRRGSERRGWSDAGRVRARGLESGGFPLGDVHASVGGSSPEVARERIATLAVTLRAFALAAGAEAAILLLDRGDAGQPFVIECPADGPVVLAEGEHVVELDAARLAADPLPLPPVRAYGPFRVDALAPLLRGGTPAEAACDALAQSARETPADALAQAAPALPQLARAVRDLAAGFPGRSVLTATFPTTDPDLPLHLAARAGDPLVLALGEQQFTLPRGWPPG